MRRGAGGAGLPSGGSRATEMWARRVYRPPGNHDQRDMPATKPSPTLSTARSEMIEVGLVVLFLSWYQDRSAAGARHPHGIVTVRTRRQGTAAAMGEIEAIEFFAKLEHSMAMVLAMGYGCHWGSRFPMTHREGTGRAPGFQTLPGTSPSALSGGPSYSSPRERPAPPSPSRTRDPLA